MQSVHDQPRENDVIYRLDEASLGSLQKGRPPSVQKAKAKAENYKLQGRRLDLQDAAARLLPTERVASCCRHAAPIISTNGEFVGTHQHVDITYSDSSESASFQNLQICNSVWMCPVCSAKITEQRRVQLTNAIQASPYHSALVTFTVRHNKWDTLRDLKNAVVKSYSNLKVGRWWQDFKKRFALVGDIRALEVTFGWDNGWHVHIHAIFLFQSKPDKNDVADIHSRLAERWNGHLNKFGFDASFKHGVDVRSGDRFVQEYLTKFGKTPDRWTLESELVKGSSKQGYEDGMTPFELLAAYAAGDKRAGALFREYCEVFKGAKQLQPSKGLYDLLNWEDHAEEEESGESEVLASVHVGWWKLICRTKQRSKLLEVASTGNKARVEEWLIQFISRFDRE